MGPESVIAGQAWDALGPLLVVVVVAALLIGAGAGVLGARYIIGRTIGQAQVEARRLVSEAQAEARRQADKTVLEAERALLERKEKFEEEVARIRSELREQERRLAKREDLFDRKEESLAARESALRQAGEALTARERDLVRRQAEIENAIRQQREVLERLAGLTPEQAKEELLRRIEEDSRAEAAKVARKITEEAEAKARERAREITLMAIQRYAGEHTAESTVRAVPIPSDDMKGRIIGREGRNIRTFERVTGVDVLVDDTPGVIVVSCFDKVRQAIAVESLERLIADGRLHPSRIEEVVGQVRAEMDERIMQHGRDAAMEVNLRGFHPKVLQAMGKLHFRTSYGQNVLRHSIEVAFLSQIIADQLGLDGTLARRCGFLHDIGKAMDHEMEGGHPKIGMEFARQYGEREPVLNAIGGHHADIPATSFYTPIVMAADSVSSARPGARRESMEKYIRRLKELQDIALGIPGVTEAYAIQAGREVRVMVDAAKVSDDEAFLIAQQIARRVSEQMTFPGEIRVTVLRETRAIEYAR